MVQLRPVTRENLDAVLALSVRETQKGFVSTAAESLAQAYVYAGTAFPFAVYADREIVGFIMMGYYEEKRYYTLWKLLIDQRYQNRGYGRKALESGIRFLKERFQADEVYTGVLPGNEAAKGLYRSVGFRETGVLENGMEELRLEIPKDTEENRMDGRIIGFLIRAKQATYAGKGAETAPSRPNSHDLVYRDGDYMYYDTYLGGRRFAGEEALWISGVPYWSMNYAGRVTGPDFSGDFLKEALMHVPEDRPFRGPREYADGGYVYRCGSEGGFDWFRGKETIEYRGEPVYECFFHGGKME